MSKLVYGILLLFSETEKTKKLIPIRKGFTDLENLHYIVMCVANIFSLSSKYYQGIERRDPYARTMKMVLVSYT